MNLGIAIKSVRKQTGITQLALSQKCNISQTSLSQIEAGAKNPSQGSIKKICIALGIPESVLYILAMQDSDVPESKKKVYNLIFPSIRTLAMQVIGSDISILAG